MSGDKLLGTRVAEGVVKPEWIDVNGHMNVAYYVLAFDLAVDACHITYQQELMEGDPYIVTAQILAYDDKRIHQFQRLYHAEKYFLAATGEWMNLHVDLETRRVSVWPESVLARLAEYSAGQTGQAYPDEAGKQMHIRKPIYTMKAGADS
jgi:acyl-CoA thioester hydrolase